MPHHTADQHRYDNPLLDVDIPDPDVTALSTGGYALVASSFDRSPGLPLWHSDDLVSWTRVGSAGGVRADAPHDGGVWAPSIRENAGLLYVTWGDPDLGILVVEASDIHGPWSEPRLVLAGRGLIDACPIWNADGTATIVHGFARSRAGFNNRIDAFPIDGRLTAATGPGSTIINGDSIEGCSVLEGPKIYRRNGEYLILAPAGGVATGWQYAFRAPALEGPWEHRIVLQQGATAVNGPHQGAWVEGADGEEWFLHFQDKGWLGRVLHLQPLRWGEDGWPVIGEPGAEGVGEPVSSWPTPGGSTWAAPAQGENFTGDSLSPDWHGRPTNPAELVVAVGHGRLTMAAGTILQPIAGTDGSWDVAVLDRRDASAVLVVADRETHALVLHADGVEIVSGETPPQQVRTGTTLGLRRSGDTARFAVDGVEVGEPFQLEGRRWTGSEWGLEVRGGGTVTFGPVRIR